MSKSRVVQSIIFPKKHWTESRAKAWLKSHGYKYGKTDERMKSFRFRQNEPKLFYRTTFRTIPFGTKIKAIVGRMKP